MKLLIQTLTQMTLGGGTWERITNGSILISEGHYEDGQLVLPGNYCGSSSHKITISEMPTHYHTYSRSSTTSGAATGNTGSTTLTINQIPKHTHSWKYALSAARGSNEWSSAGSNSTGSASDVISSAGGGQGHTHTLNNHKHSITLSTVNTGGAGGQDNMSLVQSSLACCRWHRTA